MMDFRLDVENRKWRPVVILRDEYGEPYVRYVEDVKLPQDWEVDKTIRPMVD